MCLHHLLPIKQNIVVRVVHTNITRIISYIVPTDRCLRQFTLEKSPILSIYRDPQGCDIVTTLSIAMISQSLRVAISFNSATKIFRTFSNIFCDMENIAKKDKKAQKFVLRY